MTICSIQILGRRIPYSEQTRAGRLAAPVLTVVVAVGLTLGAGQSANRVAAIHQQVVFADMHAHPSHFHRANVSRIEPDELARYRRGLIDVVVCSISTDAPFSGDYVKRDGTEVKRGELQRILALSACLVEQDVEITDAFHRSRPLNARRDKTSRMRGSTRLRDGSDGNAARHHQ